ncbi:MAG: DNA mismatch repair endonuclease MutL [Bacteroidales bacterium]|nr:DNA mismatch repair endonuclease MutL [Bacteroidales bacterium]
MGKLKVLPAQIANMIAAGEVVGRPASVVKELTENALDAGATKLTVVVTDAGRTLIQVIDNGCGMSAEDAQLCFERHATSKIAEAEDLEQIMTFGFRGEALASIAAVAEVTLRTRRPEDETGTQVTVGNFGHMEVSECSAPAGTNIAVRNLFYNTPARRKFLKSDNVELKHIVEEFTHVALTRPDVAFTLTHNGRDMFVLKAAKSLKYRIQDLLGPGITGELVDISAQTSLVAVSGFVGRPESARKTLGNQFFFVNGRYFRSPYFHKAVMNAYSEMVPDGVTPSYFIYLDVDPHSIDVNISPTKTEIKFEEDSVIFQTLYATVRETLGRNSFGASIDFDTEGAVEMPQISRSFNEYKNSEIAPSHEFDPDYNPFNPAPSSDYVPDFGSGAVGSGSTPFGSGAAPAGYVPKDENYGALFEERTLALGKSVIIGGRFIATPVSSGVMLVHIRRALVRILYEKTLRALQAEAPVTQTALFPVEVPVGAANVPLFAEYGEMLARLGFDVAPFSGDSVVVNAVPEGYASDEMSVRDLVADLLQVLADGGHNVLPEMMQSATARRFAELGAARYAELKTPAEASRLLDDLFACSSADLTPSGKRITCIVPTEEIEKRF